MHTVGAQFDHQRNSLNFLRLVFALAVIVSHTWPVGGYGADPEFAGLSLGTWAVAGFFAISGYLIANSRMHLPLDVFLIRRVLRIYPAYLVCLVVIALGFAPLSTALGSGPVEWKSAASYVLHNLLLKVFQGSIDHTLADAAYGPAWNGSLWTLIYEFLCYLAVGALLSVAVRWHRVAVVAGFLMSAAVWVAATHSGATGIVPSFTFLAAIFFAGSIIALFADRIPLDWRIGVLALVVAGVGADLHQAPWLAAMPIAYACIWLGIVLPFHKVGRTNDISYGVYIYAWPVQQIILTCLDGRRMPVGLAVLVCAAATAPLAAASWFAVERPALALKGRLGRLRLLPSAHAGAHRPALSHLSTINAPTPSVNQIPE